MSRLAQGIGIGVGGVRIGAVAGMAALGVVALSSAAVAADAGAAPPPASNKAASPASTKLPSFEVVLTGRVFGWGDDTTFPKKRAPGIVFGETFPFGKSREDGYLDLARSKDGRRLYTRLGYDDGDVQTATFELKTSGELPTGATLQMVDGRVTDASSVDTPGTFKWKDKILQQHFEAWVALPKEKVIVRPSDQSRFPLLPVTGTYDETKAAKAQWVVYVPRCKGSSIGCVYYGPPGQVCGRYVREGDTEGQGLIGYPGNCAEK